MWAWGTSIFQSEDAWDLRQVYLGYLASGDDASRWTERLMARFQPDQDSCGASFWTALAAVQEEAGRLQDDVHTRALEVIKDGSAVETWQRAGATASEVRRHEAALMELRSALQNPSPPPATAPRPLTARQRIRATMAPYWRRLSAPAQHIAAELGKPPPRDMDRVGTLLASLPPDQAWLIVAQAARSLRWQLAFCDEAVAASRERLAQRGVREDATQGGAAPAGFDAATRNDLLILARFRPQRDDMAAYMSALWKCVDDDPTPLRPPRYPESLRR